MTEQPWTAPPTYVEKNSSEMSSAAEPRDTQPVSMHMPSIQQLAGNIVYMYM